MHRKLVVAARQAGMAEVAIGVLHNVGNVLNSVNISALDRRHAAAEIEGHEPRPRGRPDRQAIAPTSVNS